MATATLTEFLRTPKDVISKIDHGAVRITRRDAADLVVLRADDLEHQQDGISLSSQLMRRVLRNGGDMRGALADLFAWTELLSPGEAEQYSNEIEHLLWSATELGSYEALLLAHHRWRETAEAYAAGMPRGTGEHRQWLPEPVDVPEP